MLKANSLPRGFEENPNTSVAVLLDFAEKTV